MKCDCPECLGSGQIPCPECAGDGDVNIPIERIKLDPDAAHYLALLAVQQDADRVIRQSAELANLKPHRAESYARQTAACLAILDHEAQTIKSTPA
jgi:hypothetical protein